MTKLAGGTGVRCTRRRGAEGRAKAVDELFLHTKYRICSFIICWIIFKMGESGYLLQRKNLI